ncbi:ABC transporter ATP-binding protein/permease [Anaerococcus hydrogenalis]|uniref:ABC transporter n=2 Tax=Anaerococcus hydrogenalis TaxID=33029 RepID=A0A2N6UIM1_9FIRM|nr:ABC transporter ATP-binding protein/permease [Anaerococcus hydrogenalis]MDK7694770.1 ABC transporter ATP-binding protein/permease [Anaerococcus hydrogenalis]MDK7696676.1 ABC transporter ATP-binding protein/permease [Anaerococcus hydrogenalis]MDK7707797.1 ABC transporter ATP-binding protein/permease [Anaerococcus hydrogenalis]PMC81407.1 ABC transporter [Anaerococcus hydrogenalis]
MLELKNISKIYKTGESEQKALDDINISFRKNEFVSILGPSGGGKTSLLNIIGGLMNYTSGDLIIDGRSTKKFKDRDWDYYRNRSVGFVFQSYNLIGHQNILKNVELALTLSGEKKNLREDLAKKALEKVGLSDHIYKKPAQLSGGQMQRVAIARALVNNPEIILADEPTGALDTETSKEIMNLLKEVAKDRLVIMVTHNPELAEKYSTRIVRLKDGKILSDTNPYEEEKTRDEFKTKKLSLSLPTALKLSFNNLLTKKARTILTAFAGSIGIIGIALILSLSNGVDDFIKESQRKTLKSYPIEIKEESLNLGENFMRDPAGDEIHNKDDKNILANNDILKRKSTLTSSISENNLSPFKSYLDKKNLSKTIGKHSTNYIYNLNLQIYGKDKDGNLINTDGSDFKDDDDNMFSSNNPSIFNIGSSEHKNFRQIISNKDGSISNIVKEEYDLIDGKWPENANELVLFTDKNNSVDRESLYELGILPKKDYKNILNKMKDGEKIKLDHQKIKTKDLIGHEFKALIPADFYKKENNKYKNIKDDENEKKKAIENAYKIKIVGIARAKKDSETNQTNTAPLGFTSKFTDQMIKRAGESQIVKDQEKNKDINILNNIAFKAKDQEEKRKASKSYLKNLEADQKLEAQSFLLANSDKLKENIKKASMNPQVGQKQGQNMDIIGLFLKDPEDKVLDKLYDEKLQSNSYQNNLENFGYVSKNAPSEIKIYVENFENRDKVKNIIDDFNKNKKEKDQIHYTDFVGLLTSSIRTIINAISYVLIAFVGISLIVSSIMIGIITYISVLERTKEIGILRSIGASKKDIRKVFLSETFMEGLLSGLLGVIVTILLNIPISKIIQNMTNISYIRSSLPIKAGVILVIISVLLTLIAGIIPSSIASKKDPVEALQSE